ncbi:MAG TPA: dihydroorotase [Fimbriimonadaceae bacterium]|nr:dihydroorotase [Armatimonadota bacterium]HRD31970.1 dihydroorotase [Fimbriimonadaceae bacterium]HRE92645.1 dihydroorotase [Fimbriimonadaceae bacterium]HRI73612.1 dihydroorotase [Fimbriimonadaceae bacterium]
MRTVFKNGRIIDPSQDLDLVGHVVVENAQVVACGPDVDISDATTVYDCTGLWITPGLVDMHVHLREPGEDYRETIKTGTRAAAAGGFTTICCLPNTTPPLDTPALIDFILDKSAAPDAGGVFVAPVGALTTVKDGQTRMANLASLKSAGIVAASDEGVPVQDANLMLHAMEYCRQLDLPIMAHCEDLSLSANGQINDGAISALLGLAGMPRTAEEVMVMRNCLLSLQTGCRVHILRVSSWGSVELIRQAKYLGAPVTAEVCPHHFCLTENDLGEFDTNFKTTPPLRTELDVDMILQGLSDGTIDAIASDHSPYAAHETRVPFDEAPFGCVGLETALGVTLTFVTHKGVLSPSETVRRLATAPSQILGLDAGTLKPETTALAQVTVIDPDVEWTFDVKKTFSRGKNSPFDGMNLKGKAVLTYCGTEIYRDALWDSARDHTTE